MKITINLLPEHVKLLERRVQKVKQDMKESRYNFDDWTIELEATTILRIGLEQMERDERQEAAGE